MRCPSHGSPPSGRAAGGECVPLAGRAAESDMGTQPRPAQQTGMGPVAPTSLYAHCATTLLAHVVWSTHRRAAWLEVSIDRGLASWLGQLAKRLWRGGHRGRQRGRSRPRRGAPSAERAAVRCGAEAQRRLGARHARRRHARGKPRVAGWLLGRVGKSARATSHHRVRPKSTHPSRPPSGGQRGLGIVRPSRAPTARPKGGLPWLGRGMTRPIVPRTLVRGASGDPCPRPVPEAGS